MLFVRYVLSFLRWNDLQFPNRTPLSSVTCSLTGAYYRLNAFSFRFPVILSVILDKHTPPGGGEGGGGTWINFCWVCAAGLPEPLPHYSLFCGNLYTPSQALLSKYVIFAIPTFYLRNYLILNEEHFTFHLQYKHSGTFAYREYEELSCPKNQKMRDPILVTLVNPVVKMRPHPAAHPHQPLIRKSPPPPVMYTKVIPIFNSQDLL